MWTTAVIDAVLERRAPVRGGASLVLRDAHRLAAIVAYASNERPEQVRTRAVILDGVGHAGQIVLGAARFEDYCTMTIILASLSGVFANWTLRVGGTHHSVGRGLSFESRGRSCAGVGLTHPRGGR